MSVGRLFVQHAACSCPREAQVNDNNAVRHRERTEIEAVAPSHMTANLELCSFILSRAT